MCVVVCVLPWIVWVVVCCAAMGSCVFAAMGSVCSCVCCAAMGSVCSCVCVVVCV